MPDTSELPPPRFEQALDELDGHFARTRRWHHHARRLARPLRARLSPCSRQCYGQLRDAEQRVKVLAGLSKTAEPS